MTRIETRDAGVVEALTLGRLDLLGVVQQGKRPDPMSAQRLVVEEHPRDDERAGERAAARLVRARDEADAEPAVVSKQALAGRERHEPEDSPPRGRPREPAPCVPDGLRGQHAAGVGLVEADLGLHAHRVAHEVDAEPVTAARSLANGADDGRRLCLDEPRAWIRSAANVVLVPGVAGDVGLDGLAREALRVVLRPTAGRAECSTHDRERKDGAHARSGPTTGGARARGTASRRGRGGSTAWPG